MAKISRLRLLVHWAPFLKFASKSSELDGEPPERIWRVQSVAWHQNDGSQTPIAIDARKTPECGPIDLLVVDDQISGLITERRQVSALKAQMARTNQVIVKCNRYDQSLPIWECLESKNISTEVTFVTGIDFFENRTYSGVVRNSSWDMMLQELVIDIERFCTEQVNARLIKRIFVILPLSGVVAVLMEN